MILLAEELCSYCPECNIFLFFFVESNQDTIYPKLNTRRLRLTILSRVETAKTFLFPLWCHTHAALSRYYLIGLHWIQRCTLVPSKVRQSDYMMPNLCTINI